MFCKKKTSGWDTLVKGVLGMLALVGAVTIVGICLKKSKPLMKKMKGLACDCGTVMEDTVREIGDSVQNAKKGN